MARRRYYRVRRVVPRRKWCSVMRSTSYTPSALPTGQTSVVYSHDLVMNSTDSNTPTPVMIKTGNFKVYGTLNTNISESDIQKLYNVTAFVMYCPQGYTYSSANDITYHPEYILARSIFKFIPGSNNSCSISSRMKRNLNTGDKICLVLMVNKESSLTGSINMYLTCQYWTCPN